jgi:hypothetical protein
MSGCRIGKIKMKAGGGEIHRLPVIERDDVQKMFVDRAAATASMYAPGDLHGYVVFAWDKDGNNTVGYFIDHKGFVGRRLLPSFVADALRDRMITDGQWGT